MFEPDWNDYWRDYSRMLKGLDYQTLNALTYELRGVFVKTALLWGVQGNHLPVRNFLEYQNEHMRRAFNRLKKMRREAGMVECPEWWGFSYWEEKWQ